MDADENRVSPILNVNETIIIKKRNTFSLEYKRSVLQRLELNECNNVKAPIKTTAIEMSVKYHLVQEWSAQRLIILESTRKISTRKLSTGRPKLYADIEEYIQTWVRTRRELTLYVSHDIVAFEVMDEFPSRFSSHEHCIGWLYNVVSDCGFTMRAKTHNQVVLAETEMGEIHFDFLEHYRRLKEFHNIPLNLIINMDETGCQFDMAPTRTLHMTGAKKVSIKATNSNNFCTVFLAVSLSGVKLRPLVVFKGVPGGPTNLETRQYDSRNSYICQKNAFCDAIVMAYWVRECLVPHKPTNVPGIIMLDNFSAHQVSSIRRQISDNSWLQLNLPPNMTSRVQILDVGINKSFKGRMKGHYNDFMALNWNNNPKVTRRLMGTWVADSWAAVPRSSIINTCRSIGFNTPSTTMLQTSIYLFTR